MVTNFDENSDRTVQFDGTFTHIYIGYKLAFASLESLGQDKTFKILESLVRLFQKVLKLIIL